jgi:hypothetical protein
MWPDSKLAGERWRRSVSYLLFVTLEVFMLTPVYPAANELGRFESPSGIL